MRKTLLNCYDTIVALSMTYNAVKLLSKSFSVKIGSHWENLGWNEPKLYSLWSTQDGSEEAKAKLKPGE